MNDKPERARGKADGGGVQSLARAFALLECVARAPHGVGLSDLGRQLGLHSSTTFNLARTMVDLGYLAQSAGDKRYRIGRSLLCLAANAIDDQLLVDRAKSAMEALSRATGEASTFAVWSGQNVIALARTNGTGAFQLADRVGSVRPPHATATGHILLASLPVDRFEAYLANADLAAFTPTTITDRDELRSEVARVRQTGHALDNGQFHEDVCCIAVPVLDFSGHTVGSMGVSGPIGRMTARARARHAMLLADAARALSRELGHGGLAASGERTGDARSRLAAASATGAADAALRSAPKSSAKAAAAKPAASSATRAGPRATSAKQAAARPAATKG